jgi:hypothetical protein
VRELLEQGKGVKEIARILGIKPPSVCFHKRRLGYAMDGRCSTRFDWAAIQRYYDAGHSRLECQRRFGFSVGSWGAAVKRGAIVPRPFPMPLDELLIRGPRNRRHVKLRLIDAGLKKNACEECGISEWRDKPLSLELHHRNGEKHDNRLENLAILCPNCHSQSDTWGGKNAGVVVPLRPASERA